MAYSADYIRRLREEEEGLPTGRDVALHEEAKRLRMSSEDLDVFLRVGLKQDDVPLDLGVRMEAIKYIRKRGEAPPRWLQISGLWPELSRSDMAFVRRAKIRALYKELIRIVQMELKDHAADPNGWERSIFRDPVIEVCRYLEISESALSKYCKELTGNSLKQAIDCVRTKGLKEKMKAGLVKELGAYFAARSEGVENEKWVVWKFLKTGRRWPEFSQNGWANGFGFCSYRRMYRACLVVFGMTPHQMEMGMISEMLLEGVGEETKSGEVMVGGADRGEVMVPDSGGQEVPGDLGSS